MYIKTFIKIALVSFATLASAADSGDKIHPTLIKPDCQSFLGYYPPVYSILSVTKSGELIVPQAPLETHLNKLSNPAPGGTLPNINAINANTGFMFDVSVRERVLFPNIGTNGRLVELVGTINDYGRNTVRVGDISESGEVTTVDRQMLSEYAASMMKMHSPTHGKTLVYILDMQNRVWQHDPVTLRRLPLENNNPNIPLAKVDPVGLKAQPLIHRYIRPWFDGRHILYHVLYGEYRLIDIETGKTVAQANDWSDWSKVVRKLYPNEFYVEMWGDNHHAVAHFYGPNQAEPIWMYASLRMLNLDIMPLTTDRSVVLVSEPIEKGFEDRIRMDRGLQPLPLPIDPRTGKPVVLEGPQKLYDVTIKDLASGAESKTRLGWRPQLALPYPDEIGTNGKPGRVWLVGAYGQRAWLDFPALGGRR